MKVHKFHLLCSKDQGTAENKHTSLIPEQSLLLLYKLVAGMHSYFLVHYFLIWITPRKKMALSCTGVHKDLKYVQFYIPDCYCHYLEICNREYWEFRSSCIEIKYFFSFMSCHILLHEITAKVLHSCNSRFYKTLFRRKNT